MASVTGHEHEWRYDLDKCDKHDFKGDNLVPPPSRPLEPTTDTCPDCEKSGRHIARFGHDEGCPRRPYVAGIPTDYSKRKALPLYDFMFGYFPLAWLEVVKVAVAGNDQHNPGEKLHWAREKSTDQLNTAMRHLFDHGTGSLLDTDGCYHLAKVIWRLSAELQLIVERNGKS